MGSPPESPFTHPTEKYKKRARHQMLITYLDSSRILHLSASAAITETQIVDGILLNPFVHLVREEAADLVSQMIDAVEEGNVEYRPITPLPELIESPV
jgi:hypothetical protein